MMVPCLFSSPPAWIRHWFDALLLSTCSDARSATDWNQCWMPQCCRRPCPWSMSCGDGNKSGITKNSSMTWAAAAGWNELSCVMVNDTQVIRDATVKYQVPFCRICLWTLPLSLKYVGKAADFTGSSCTVAPPGLQFSIHNEPLKQASLSWVHFLPTVILTGFNMFSIEGLLG